MHISGDTKKEHLSPKKNKAIFSLLFAY